MKENIIKKLILLLTIAGLLSVGVFTFLVNYNQKVSAVATSELGSLYMSEIKFQVQDHFETIIDFKIQEVAHIAQHPKHSDITDFRLALRSAAANLGFDYLALYDENGNYDMLLGEAAWYRNLNGFVSSITAHEKTATTGYLTSTGGKYIVFGIPAQYEMESGQSSSVLLVGFSVEKLYNYINLDELEPLGGNAHIDIILTNGSYVLKENTISETSFFHRMEAIGSFVGMDIEEGVAKIEKAMASATSFSCMVTLDGEQQHIYGFPVNCPSDWYFVISMPQGPSDIIINAQNTSISHAFVFSGALVMLLFITVFLLYLRMSIQQIKETEAAWKDAEEARAEAETANMAKSTFLSNMSHDIRTPMNAIVGFTEILEKNIASGNYDIASEYLTKMKRSSDYLRNLINDVLDMSKIESGMLTISPEPMSLQTTLDTVIMVNKTRALSNQQTFQVDIHDILHDGITCDPTRLKQILILNYSRLCRESG